MDHLQIENIIDNIIKAYIQQKITEAGILDNLYKQPEGKSEQCKNIPRERETRR